MPEEPTRDDIKQNTSALSDLTKKLKTLLGGMQTEQKNQEESAKSLKTIAKTIEKQYDADEEARDDAEQARRKEDKKGGGAFGFLKGGFPKLPKLSGPQGMLASLFGFVAAKGKKAGDILLAPFRALADFFTTLLTKIIELIKAPLKLIMDFIGMVGRAIGQVIGGVIEGVLTGIGRGLQALAPGLAALANPHVLIGMAAVFAAIVGFIAAVKLLKAEDFIIGLAKAFGETLVNALEVLAGIAKTVIKEIADIFKTVVKTVPAILDSLKGFTLKDAAGLAAVGGALIGFSLGLQLFATTMVAFGPVLAILAGLQKLTGSKGLGTLFSPIAGLIQGINDAFAGVDVKKAAKTMVTTAKALLATLGAMATLAPIIFAGVVHKLLKKLAGIDLFEMAGDVVRGMTELIKGPMQDLLKTPIDASSGNVEKIKNVIGLVTEIMKSFDEMRKSLNLDFFGAISNLFGGGGMDKAINILIGEEGKPGVIDSMRKLISKKFKDFIEDPIIASIDTANLPKLKSVTTAINSVFKMVAAIGETMKGTRGLIGKVFGSAAGGAEAFNDLIFAVLGALPNLVTLFKGAAGATGYEMGIVKFIEQLPLASIKGIKGKIANLKIVSDAISGIFTMIGAIGSAVKDTGGMIFSGDFEDLKKTITGTMGLLQGEELKNLFKESAKFFSDKELGIAKVDTSIVDNFVAIGKGIEGFFNSIGKIKDVDELQTKIIALRKAMKSAKVLVSDASAEINVTQNGKLEISDTTNDLLGKNNQLLAGIYDVLLKTGGLASTTIIDAKQARTMINNSAPVAAGGGKKA